MPETSIRIEVECVLSYYSASYPLVPYPPSSWFPNSLFLPQTLHLLQLRWSCDMLGIKQNHQLLEQVLKQCWFLLIIQGGHAPKT